MHTLGYQIVRPDKLLHQGDATAITFVARTGEIGVLPGHAKEICALGKGICRIEHEPDDEGNTTTRIAIFGGYAEITEDEVIVLADHARNVNDIYPDVVNQTKQDAEAELNKLPKQDSRRVYFEQKIQWCDLLLDANRQFGNH